jgi:hypothetical protein
VAYPKLHMPHSTTLPIYAFPGRIRSHDPYAPKRGQQHYVDHAARLQHTYKSKNALLSTTYLTMTFHFPQMPNIPPSPLQYVHLRGKPGAATISAPDRFHLRHGRLGHL